MKSYKEINSIQENDVMKFSSNYKKYYEGIDLRKRTDIIYYFIINLLVNITKILNFIFFSIKLD